jgi:hypothetical protein
VAKLSVEAQAENGPQFLGASLVFVRALEVLAGKDRENAFYLTEQAARRAGLGLQIHLDDHHGKYDLAAMDDTALASLARDHHTGCSFATYAWGEDADAVIMEAKRRQWRIQILAGEHHEQGAVINHRVGETFDTAVGADAGAAQFNTDVAEARKMFEILESLIVESGFAHKAEAWMLDTYKDVVVALKGVSSADEVVEIT